MATIKVSYPSTSSQTITCSVASLASGSAGVYTAGQASTAIDNTANNDLDHLLSGSIRTGTTPTAGRLINIYAWANINSTTGTPTYPDSITGTDGAKTFTSANVMNGCVIWLKTIVVDAVTGRDYSFGPISIAQAFGGVLPKFYGIYVTHDTAVALDSTASNHFFVIERVQQQVV